ncbi:GNAT family N-acetyltransferase [Methylobrevis albus]|uniref:GNAT family N-acetyltransferase n=1 Tax=Methylobrevis albus TaxID=2793297 RepID=A0A931MXM2_9HYPH|nr:GNAT family protein [Methylobrevis albus]MBH0237100.1 GNAT family N-acetyltransferase [Methylobrevis albus]
MSAVAEPLLNAFGQPVGRPLGDWSGAARPPRTPADGRLVRLEPLDPDRHGDDLFAAFGADAEGRNWTYLGYGPFADRAAFGAWMDATCRGDDPLFHAVIDRVTGRAVGVASYLRIDPAGGVIEVGHIHLSPALQRTAQSTEAMFLLMARAFDDLGYRRYEWKCDRLNAPSMRAAERLGFVFEGIFRQATHYKGRNRDTAWFSVVDGDWPVVKAAFLDFLSPSNFDGSGRQIRSLASIRAGRAAERDTQSTV